MTPLDPFEIAADSYGPSLDVRIHGYATSPARGVDKLRHIRPPRPSRSEPNDPILPHHPGQERASRPLGPDDQHHVGLGIPARALTLYG